MRRRSARWRRCAPPASTLRAVRARAPARATRQAWVLRERESGERTVLELRDPRCGSRRRTSRTRQIARAAALLVDAEHPEASLHALRLARRAGA